MQQNSVIMAIKETEIPFSNAEITNVDVDEFSVMEHYNFGNPVALSLLSQDNTLFETLLRSMPLEQVKRYADDAFNLPPNQIQIKEFNGIKCAYVYYDVYRKDSFKEMIIELMQRCGYFLSTEIKGKGRNDGVNRMKFEPSVEENVDEEVRNIGLMIHITTRQKVNKINAIGLTPRSNNSIFEYPARIYLISGKASSTQILSLAKALQISKSLNGDINNEYVQIMVNTKRLPNNIHFFKDPNLVNCFYTHDNIPPSAIYNIQPIKIK